MGKLNGEFAQICEIFPDQFEAGLKLQSIQGDSLVCLLLLISFKLCNLMKTITAEVQFRKNCRTTIPNQVRFRKGYNSEVQFRTILKLISRKILLC